jgi:molybdopterin synthase sulfur carrier subunit
MKINFYATLRQIVGQKTVEVSLPDGADVQQLVAAVVAQYPALRPELLDESGNIYGHINLFINGRDAHHTDDGLKTLIQPDDKIDIFPAVAGG